jgi:hypothetical protein
LRRDDGRIDELWAVWDGQPTRGYGGTADVVALARQRAGPVTVFLSEGATRDRNSPQYQS